MRSRSSILLTATLVLLTSLRCTTTTDPLPTDNTPPTLIWEVTVHPLTGSGDSSEKFEKKGDAALSVPLGSHVSISLIAAAPHGIQQIGLIQHTNWLCQNPASQATAPNIPELAFPQTQTFPPGPDGKVPTSAFMLRDEDFADTSLYPCSDPQHPQFVKLVSQDLIGSATNFATNNKLVITFVTP